jgi:hypothetical protein
MNQDELALNKAVESRQTDLIHLVLFHLKRKSSSKANMFRLVSKNPTALKLLEVYLKENEPETLQDFYYQDDRQADIAKLFVEKAQSLGMQEKSAMLREAQHLYAKNKKTAVHHQTTSDQIKLLQVQSSLEFETNQSFLGMSATSTLEKCLSLNKTDKALKLKKDLNIPEKRYKWLEMKYYVNSQKWEEFFQFIKLNPKMGYFKATIDLLMDQNNRAQTTEYIDLLPKAQQKEALLYVGQWDAFHRQ